MDTFRPLDQLPKNPLQYSVAAMNSKTGKLTTVTVKEMIIANTPVRWQRECIESFKALEPRLALIIINYIFIHAVPVLFNNHASDDEFLEFDEYLKEQRFNLSDKDRELLFNTYVC